MEINGYEKEHNTSLRMLAPESKRTVTCPSPQQGKSRCMETAPG